MFVLPSKPLIGFSAAQDDVLTAPDPANMYGPVAMMSRPYLLASAPVKHLPTSGGIGAVAGIPRRKRKSPVGCVRWKTIVLAFGVVIPEILPPFFAASFQPLI